MTLLSAVPGTQILMDGKTGNEQVNQKDITAPPHATAQRDALADRYRAIGIPAVAAAKSVKCDAKRETQHGDGTLLRLVDSAS